MNYPEAENPNPDNTVNPQQYEPPTKTKFVLIFVIIVILVAASALGAFFFLNKGEEEIIMVPINQTQGNESNLALDCTGFSDKLETCEPFSCEFEHPLAEALGINDTIMERRIIGLTNDGKCNYTEEMPNNGTMDCEYSESFRREIAQFYRDLANAESSGGSSSTDILTGETNTTYTIDGKEVANPLQEAVETGVCVISGYE